MLVILTRVFKQRWRAEFSTFFSISCKCQKRHMEVFIVEMSVTYFNVLIDEDVLITSCLALLGCSYNC